MNMQERYFIEVKKVQEHLELDGYLSVSNCKSRYEKSIRKSTSNEEVVIEKILYPSRYGGVDITTNRYFRLIGDKPRFLKK